MHFVHFCYNLLVLIQGNDLFFMGQAKQFTERTDQFTHVNVRDLRLRLIQVTST